jgi:hypothetical protein
VLESVLPDKKDGKVKEKQLDALKRMGHQELELDEYESALWVSYRCGICLIQR